ncbi:hypothetical protein Rumeso_05005 [Rubellimicrobium mesophilum DSM 19309]|uniref:Uncharacterized protein n=1 Tax=Rubellimicrobium mesophilum DSM 19309 TaxID=442562 RepID=A0A017HCV7_9RHOB|nr:hypothetical protein [Rubellimicrobium mesophilum]EYD71604.1 hypothetical protein Rumeso_05005 [Rubellimicrobium mesophilum DSM 19309]
MANRPALIKQADLTRIAKAMQSAGVAEWRLEMEPSGKMAIIAGQSGAAPAARKSDWDDL